MENEEERTEYFILQASYLLHEGQSPLALRRSTAPTTPSTGSPHTAISHGTVLFPRIVEGNGNEETRNHPSADESPLLSEKDLAKLEAFTAFKKSIVEMEWEADQLAAELGFKCDESDENDPQNQMPRLRCHPSLDHVRQRLSRVDAIYGAEAQLSEKGADIGVQSPSLEGNHNQTTGMQPDPLGTSSTYLEKHFTGPMKEQRDYFTLRLKEMERSTEGYKDQLKAAKEKKIQRQTKLEKHIQLTLLADLYSEKEAEFMKLDERKRSLAMELARMVRNTICMEKQKDAALNSGGQEGEGGQLGNLSQKKEEEEEEKLHSIEWKRAQLSELWSCLLPHAEQLWKDVIQMPRLVQPKHLNGDDTEESISLDLPVRCGWAECRRTMRGGVSGAIEEEGWHRVRSAMWKACWDTHPYFGLYGGATEDHLKSKPLHTFLKSLRQVQREAFIGEELYRARITTEAPAASPTGMTGASVSRRLQQNTTMISTAPFFRYFKSEEALREKSWSKKLEQLEKRVWFENSLLPWKQEAERLLMAQFQLLNRVLMPPGNSETASSSERKREGERKGESHDLMRVQLEWYVPQEEQGKTAKEEALENTPTPTSPHTSSNQRTLKTCPTLATRFLLRCGLPVSVFQTERPDMEKAQEEEVKEDLNVDITQPQVSISSSTVSFQTEMVMNPQLAQSVSEMNRRIIQRERSRSWGVGAEDLRGLTPKHANFATTGDVLASNEPVDVLFSTPHKTPKALEKQPIDESYFGSSPGPRLRDGECSKLFTVENFIRHRIVQGALTFSPEAFLRREEHRIHVQAQNRQQRELEETLAEVLEENYQLERQIRELEEEENDEGYQDH